MEQKTKKHTGVRRGLLCAVYGLILALVLGAVQTVLCGAGNAKNRRSFYHLPRNSVDLLLVGSSNMFCTVDPVQLYDEFGLLSYDFGSSSQMLDMSLLYLQEAFKYQQPRVVAIEVLKTYEDAEDPNWDLGKSYHWGYPTLKFSPEKLHSILHLCRIRQENPLDYLFPGVAQHTRWREVQWADVAALLPTGQPVDPMLGFVPLDGVEPIAPDYEREGQSVIPASNVHWYREISALCREHGAQVVWFRAPFETWTRAQAQPIQDLVEQMGDQWLDLNVYMDEIGLDPAQDFYNMGHLNREGAAKATRFMGRYILDRYDLPRQHAPERDSVWRWASQEAAKGRTPGR